MTRDRYKNCPEVAGAPLSLLHGGRSPSQCLGFLAKQLILEKGLNSSEEADFQPTLLYLFELGCVLDSDMTLCNFLTVSGHYPGGEKAI